MSDDARMVVAAAFALLFVVMMWWLRDAPETWLMAIKPLATGATLGTFVYWLLGHLPVSSGEGSRR